MRWMWWVILVCAALGAGIGYLLQNWAAGFIYGIIFGAAAGAIADRRKGFRYTTRF